MDLASLSITDLNNIPVFLSSEKNKKSLYHQLKTLDRVSFTTLLDRLSHLYHNENLLISDEDYDFIEDIYTTLYGQYKKIGAPPLKGMKVKLPHYLGGLDKIKTNKSLQNWLDKFECTNFNVTDKLDGVSALVTYNNGKKRLYKRGDEYEGMEISHLLPYLAIPEVYI